MPIEQELEKRDFEMFSKKGNNACRSLVKKVFKKIEGKTRVTEESVTEIISEGCKKIFTTHPEVYDTEPGYHIQYLVNSKLEEIGYSFQVSRYEF